MKKVAVFCGAAIGTDPDLLTEIQQFIQLLAKSGMELIYGGGKVGIMGMVADTALQHGGTVAGVMPQMLIDKELTHAALSQLIIVDSFSTRKKTIYDRADTLILLPGGIGSMDEFFDALSQIHVGSLSKKMGILNVKNYYDPLLAQLRQAVALDFMQQFVYDLLQIGKTAQDLFDKLQATKPMAVDRWQRESANDVV